jgi:hypothetical protein
MYQRRCPLPSQTKRRKRKSTDISLISAYGFVLVSAIMEAEVWEDIGMEVLLRLCGSVHYINQPSLKKDIQIRLFLHLSFIPLWSWHTYKKSWVRIGKRFKEPRNRFHLIGSASLFVAWRAGMTTLFVVPQEPRNRFLDTINAYKFGLWVSVMEVNAFCRFLCFRQLPRALLVTFYDINKE